MNSDQIVCIAEFKLGKVGGPVDGFKGGRDEWQRIFVLDCDLCGPPLHSQCNAGVRLSVMCTSRYL